MQRRARARRRAGVSGVALRGTDLRVVGVITGWGEGIAALPADAASAAAGRSTLAIDRLPMPGERFRRATRECRLGRAAGPAVLHAAALGAGGCGGGQWGSGRRALC